jgi:multidrug efflux pump subunit AcrA (membrane-fusion protein)
MGTTRAKWFRWLAALAAMAVLGGGLWYGWREGWLTSAYHRLLHGHAATTEHGGMGMNMPGMEMGPSPEGETMPTSGVPGHAVVMVAPEFQQRLGVTVGVVEKAPLRMSVRTVGIVRPDETRLARVHIRTEGWTKKQFVNYVGAPVKKGDPLLSIYSPQFLTTQQQCVDDLRFNEKDLAEAALQ